MTTTNYDVRCAHCDETKLFSQMKWRERTFHMHEKCPERNERTPGTVINNIQASSQCDSTPDLNARNGISRDVGGEFYPEQRDLTYETTNEDEDAADDDEDNDDGECNDVEERDDHKRPQVHVLRHRDRGNGLQLLVHPPRPLHMIAWRRCYRRCWRKGNREHF